MRGIYMPKDELSTRRHSSIEQKNKSETTKTVNNSFGPKKNRVSNNVFGSKQSFHDFQNTPRHLIHACES